MCACKRLTAIPKRCFARHNQYPCSCTYWNRTVIHANVWSRNDASRELTLIGCLRICAAVCNPQCITCRGRHGCTIPHKLIRLSFSLQGPPYFSIKWDCNLSVPNLYPGLDLTPAQIEPLCGPSAGANCILCKWRCWVYCVKGAQLEGIFCLSLIKRS